MAKSTVFTSNRGHSRVIVPQGKRWDDLFLHGPRASDDFLNDREQPAALVSAAAASNKSKARR